MIKAVGFDWGGVLNGKPGKYFASDMANLLSISIDEYREAYFKHNKKINRGEVTWRELWSLVLSELDKSEKIEEVIKLSERFGAISLNKDVISVVDHLSSNGYKVGLLSNNTIEKANKIRETGLESHFDTFLISEETGNVKPEPDAFLQLATSLGVTVNELVFIDDAPKSLSTAKEVGFTPILFDNAEQLKKDLAQLGVKLN